MEKVNNLISPLPIYARVKEELRTFFNTNSIDDLLFPIWTADCINKFENTYIPIKEAALDLYNHRCPLPCDFKSVREVWVTFCYDKGPITSPHVFYYQTDCRIEPSAANGCSDCVPGYQCMGPGQTPTPVNLPSLCDVPSEYIVTHKVMDQMVFRFHVTGLLKPGNFKTIGKCAEGSPNLAKHDSFAWDTFDIMGNELITSFAQGTVYMAYYGYPEMITDTEGPEQGYYLIPDNKPFYDYLYYYLTYMVFRQVFNNSMDDTFRISAEKLKKAEQDKDDAYINARNYAISGTVYSSMYNGIVRSYNRHNRFRIPRY